MTTMEPQLQYDDQLFGLPATTEVSVQLADQIANEILGNIK